MVSLRRSIRKSFPLIRIEWDQSPKEQPDTIVGCEPNILQRLGVHRGYLLGSPSEPKGHCCD